MENLFSPLQTYLRGLSTEAIAAERQAELAPLASFLAEQLQATGEAHLTFICTHNSRRSHFGQVWARVWAVALGLEQVCTYSGGTEATACHPNTLRALATAGLRIESPAKGSNPQHLLHFSASYPPIEVWSKVYTDPANPQTGFGAIMTCDSANEACPVVAGAAARFPLLYQDPKAYDDTPQAATAYAERCAQVAAEMGWVMRRVAVR